MFAGIDPLTGRQRYVHETVHLPNNRPGANKADPRLAELIVAVEEDRLPAARAPRKADVLTMGEPAERWMRANQPRQNRRTGQWIGWSPTTAKTHGDNFRTYILPRLGDHDVASITGLDLDDLYSALGDRPWAVALGCRPLLWSDPGDVLLGAAQEAPRRQPGAVGRPSSAQAREVVAVLLEETEAFDVESARFAVSPVAYGMWDDLAQVWKVICKSPAASATASLRRICCSGVE